MKWVQCFSNSSSAKPKIRSQPEITPRTLRQTGGWNQTVRTNQPVPREITALLSEEWLILRETQRAVNRFGGIAVSVRSELRDRKRPVALDVRHGLGI